MTPPPTMTFTLTAPTLMPLPFNPDHHIQSKAVEGNNPDTTNLQSEPTGTQSYIVAKHVAVKRATPLQCHTTMAHASCHPTRDQM